MLSGTIAFFLGLAGFQLLPALPPLWSLASLPLAGAFAAMLRPRVYPRIVTLVTLACAGFLWAWGHAAVRLADALPPAWEGRDVEVVGRLVGLPENRERRVRFVLDAESIRVNGVTYPPPGRLRLSWYGAHPQLTPGERWRLVVRLKRPHGFMNPGGFDYERWLFSRGIRATGYVRSRDGYERLAGGVGLDRFRAEVSERVAESLGERPATALLQALVVGDRRNVTDAQWEVLASTGTTHLMAISGLHIGLVAGLALLFGRWTWSRCTVCCLRWPALRAGAIAGLVAAAAYAALAGFSVPTQRALVMSGVAMAALLAGRGVLTLRTLAVALLAVVVIDPFAVLAWGFWLSFGAVAAILYAATGRLRARSRLGSWITAQWAVTLGLAPLLLIAFGEASSVAPLVNLWAIPWVGFLVVPSALIGTLLLAILPAAGDWLLGLSATALDGCWWSLERAAAGAPLEAMAPAWTLLPAALGLMMLLAPRGVPGRAVGTLGLLPLLLFAPARPIPGEAWVTVLDVGQGLALVAETARHTLVYDTGPRFTPKFNAGDAVLVPFLRSRGATRVDTLVLSHGDEDHSGGLDAVMTALPVESVLTTVPGRGRSCRRGQRWEWDGVSFEVLHPPSNWQGGNDASCVLRIVAGGQALLATGDIEAAAEAALVQALPGRLPAEVLVAPHHGSRTSSSEAFIAATEPAWVVASTGYRNRFGFPHPQIATRYREAGAQLVETATAGAVRIRLGDGDGASVQSYRTGAARYWNAEAALCQVASLC